MRRYTKKDAVREYKQWILPKIKDLYEQDGQVDSIARSEAWSNYTDSLCKDGRITVAQYEGWTCPRICH